MGYALATCTCNLAYNHKVTHCFGQFDSIASCAPWSCGSSKGSSSKPCSHQCLPLTFLDLKKDTRVSYIECEHIDSSNLESALIDSHRALRHPKASFHHHISSRFSYGPLQSAKGWYGRWLVDSLGRCDGTVQPGSAENRRLSNEVVQGCACAARRQAPWLACKGLCTVSFFLLRTPCHRAIKILWRWVGLERAQFRASDLVLSPCMSLRPVRSKTAQTQASPHHLQLSRHRLDEPELQVEQLQIVQWYDIVWFLGN